MMPFVEKVPAIIYAWYPGQAGNTALAQILSGAVNPSGKLPITIEKKFEDSPGYGYIPEGWELYNGWQGDKFTHDLYDIKYEEGIFVGYRWYEHQNIEPLFAFGHGLSYSRFRYSDLKVAPEKFTGADAVTVSFTIENTSEIEGAEVVQVYVQDVACSYPRPVKELKGFEKINLKPGEKLPVKINLDALAFSFWNPGTKQWEAEKRRF